MDELLSEFISETQETLAALAGEVIAWEANPGDTRRLDAIFRFFHTVKGSCGFLHLPRFERLSHAAEDVLSDIRQGKRQADPATVSAVLGIMDRIGELADAVADGSSLAQENDDYLLSALSGATAAVAEPVVVMEQATTSAPTRQMRTIRLPLTLIDQLMNGVSDMVLARNELARKLRERQADPELDGVFERLSTSVADMRDAISKTRMQRIDRLFAAIPRMVRDLGRELGKSIDLRIEGGDVEMDREMVEMIVDPLTHIIRNAIDHGIETPDVRRAAGKPETGSLRVAARQSGNQILVTIADDGKGLDSDRLVAKAIDLNLIDKDAASRLSEAQRLDLIFSPGFSTASQVTSISGRGVGMDIVRSNIERIGGVISLESQLGKGLVITLRVPLTLTIIPGLIIRAGGQQLALPRAAIVEILHDNNETLSIAEIGGARIATIRSVRHSMVDLEDVLGLPKTSNHGVRTIVVIRAASGVPYALGVETVENHEELVIRPASPLVMAPGLYAGMTLPDSGRPMLLLDAGGIANAANLPVVPVEDDAAQAEVAATSEYSRVSALHFRELTGEDRLIPLALVERVEDIDAAHFGRSGGKSFVRIDDRLLPVANGHSDFAEGKVTSLRLRDDDQELCYPVAQVIDILDMPRDPDMSMGGGIILGVSVIDGTHMEIIDPFFLFANADTSDRADNSRRRCFLANDQDPWVREILAPLIRQAGHVIMTAADGEATDADIVLFAGDDTPEELPADRPLVRLRRTSRPQGPEDRSIYRYDRDALIAAIESTRTGRAA